MDFERFQEFMLQSAAKHDAQIDEIHLSLKQLSHTAQILLDNQIHLQDSIDRVNGSISELASIVRSHVTDPNGHQHTHPT